jgi:hypothetical protein
MLYSKVETISRRAGLMLMSHECYAKGGAWVGEIVPGRAHIQGQGTALPAALPVACLAARAAPCPVMVALAVPWRSTAAPPRHMALADTPIHVAGQRPAATPYLLITER